MLESTTPSRSDATLSNAPRFSSSSSDLRTHEDLRTRQNGTNTVSNLGVGSVSASTVHSSSQPSSTSLNSHVRDFQKFKEEGVVAFDYLIHNLHCPSCTVQIESICDRFQGRSFTIPAVLADTGDGAMSEGEERHMAYPGRPPHQHPDSSDRGGNSSHSPTDLDGVGQIEELRHSTQDQDARPAVESKSAEMVITGVRGSVDVLARTAKVELTYILNQSTPTEPFPIGTLDIRSALRLEVARKLESEGGFEVESIYEPGIAPDSALGRADSETPALDRTNTSTLIAKATNGVEGGTNDPEHRGHSNNRSRSWLGGFATTLFGGHFTSSSALDQEELQLQTNSHEMRSKGSSSVKHHDHDRPGSDDEATGYHLDGTSGHMKHLAYCQACQFEIHDGLDRSSSFQSPSRSLHDEHLQSKHHEVLNDLPDKDTRGSSMTGRQGWRIFKRLNPRLGRRLRKLPQSNTDESSDVRNRQTTEDHIVSDAGEGSQSGAGELEIVVEPPKVPRVWVTKLSVVGMTCSACTSSIRDAFSAHPAIVDSSISHLTHSATVWHDGDRLDAQKVAELIDDMGFEAEVINSEQDTASEPLIQPSNQTTSGSSDGPDDLIARTTLTVEGMTCASCAQAISRALEDLGDSVIEIDIQVLTKVCRVVHRLPNQLGTANGITAEQIRNVIDDCGFEAKIEDVSMLSVSEHPSSSAGEHSEAVATAPRSVNIKVEGIFCECVSLLYLEQLSSSHLADIPNLPRWLRRCVEKLNRRLTFLLDEKQIHSFSPFTRQKHQTTVVYVPGSPLNVRSLVVDLASQNADVFRVSIIRPKTITDRSREIQTKERRHLFVYFVVAFAIAVPTFVISIVGMMLLPHSNPFRMWLHQPLWGQADRGTIAVWILASASEFGPGRIRAMFTFGSMDLLVVLSTSVAYIASVVMMILDIIDSPARSDSESYFDSCVFLIFFILGGRTLEAYAKSKTSDAIAILGAMRPSTALILPREIEDKMFDSHGLRQDWTDAINSGLPSASEPVQVSAEYLDINDTILVRAGDMPAADGVIVHGTTSFDESNLSGESRPVNKAAGDQIATGTVNISNVISVRVSAVGQGTILDGIITAVAEASSHKSQLEKLTERLTGLFVPVVVYISLIVVVAWLAAVFSGALPETYVGSAGRSLGGRLFFALEFAIATLVVSCPCGLSLGSPTAQAVGVGIAAKQGVLAAGGGQAFQAGSKVSHVLLDKTGTITTAQTQVTQQRIHDESILPMVRELESQSSHPLARAIVAHLHGQDSDGIKLLSSRETAGSGLEGICSDESGRVFDVIIGNESLLKNHGVDMGRVEIDEWRSSGYSVVLVAFRQAAARYRFAAAFAVGDTVRKESPEVIANLKKRGLQVWMVSGDNQITANAVARSVGINSSNVLADLKPEDKAAVIRKFQQERVAIRSWRGKTHRLASVMFVGDGLNDAIAISQADVGVAMSHGSQGTVAAADFALMGSSLDGLPRILGLSKKVFNRQKLNFMWAWVFNGVCIPFAAGVFYPSHQIRLPAIWSALAMSLSSTS